MSFGGTPPASPARWNEAEAERLRSYHGGARDAGPTGQRSLIRRDRDEGFDSPPPPSLTPHEKSLVWQALCARVDELRRMPVGYSGYGDHVRIREMRELAEKLERMGIVALDLAGYAP